MLAGPGRAASPGLRATAAEILAILVPPGLGELKHSSLAASPWANSLCTSPLYITADSPTVLIRYVLLSSCLYPAQHFGLSSSSFYSWLQRPGSIRSKALFHSSLYDFSIVFPPFAGVLWQADIKTLFSASYCWLPSLTEEQMAISQRALALQKFLPLAHCINNKAGNVQLARPGIIETVGCQLKSLSHPPCASSITTCNQHRERQ